MASAIWMLFLCFLVHTPSTRAEPVPTHCGRGRFHGEKRIVGGEVSRDGEWPWLVSIMPLEDGNPRHACGGTLIAPQWVVSAAHCFDERLNFSSNTNDYILRLGEHNMTDDDAFHFDVQPERIIAHTGFDPFATRNSNDIALIKLPSAVEMSERVNVACLPEAEEEFPSSCTAVGWGRVQHNVGGTSPVLRHVELDMLDSSVCEKAYPHFPTDWNLIICAGETTVGGKGSCEGDSGGPLMCYDGEDNEWVLAGVVSGGELCSHKDFPGIYTHVPTYLQWIEDKMAEN